MRGRTARDIEHRPVDHLEELLVLAGRADEHAFAQLYDEVSHRAYGLALRVIGDPDQAQEVTQEVFLEVWRKAATFEPGRGSAVGWVLSVTHRRAVDRVRSSTAAVRRDNSWHDTAEQESDFDATFDAAHANLEARSVTTALSHLSPIQRRAVELAYFGGYTHADVSRLMEAPLGTTKTRIRTALLRLREHLDAALVEPAIVEPAIAEPT